MCWLPQRISPFLLWRTVIVLLILQGKHSQAKSLNPVNSNAIKPVTNVNQEPKVTLSGLLNFIDGLCRAVKMRGSQYSQLIIKTDLTLHLLLHRVAWTCTFICPTALYVGSKCWPQTTFVMPNSIILDYGNSVFIRKHIRL